VWIVHERIPAGLGQSGPPVVEGMAVELDEFLKIRFRPAVREVVPPPKPPDIGPAGHLDRVGVVGERGDELTRRQPTQLQQALGHASILSPRGRGAAFVAAAFAVSGTVHLVRPQVFDALVPRVLPARRTVIYASGLAELVCAAGLVTKQRWAPAASAALLVAVWPGNWKMALDTQRSSRAHPVVKAAAWVRVPLQLALIRAAWRAQPTHGEVRVHEHPRATPEFTIHELTNS